MNDEHPLSRRDFVKTVAGAAAAAGLAGATRPLESLALPAEAPTSGPAAGSAASTPAGATANATPHAAMATRPLGRTGHFPCLFSLGGQATLERPGTEAESVAIIERAIDLGVNYIDTARRYGNGISETYIGQVMAKRRKEVFLASKTRDRTYDGSMRSLEESLKALRTDHLDLWQLHNVQRQEDLDQIFADDGALKALQKARDEKIVRFLGITGHFDPAILKLGIERFPFDTVLVALNAADRQRASFIDTFLPAAVEKGMGIIGMKIPARGRLLRADGVATMKDAMDYVLTLPVSTIIVGISKLEELEENIRIATAFQPLDAAAMARLEALAKPYAEEAAFFKMPA